MEELILELKKAIIEALNLEEVKPEDIDNDAPLFGDGLGLDSIDALELIVLMEKRYGIKLQDPDARFSAASMSWLTISPRIARNNHPE